MDNRDIFICHASKDKEEIVRPMVEAFSQAGITCWYDEAEIKWGDSIPDKINKGLKISRYVIVVFSSTFIEKEWPKKEFNAALNIEASSGEVKVLPLIVGSEMEKKQILNEYPLLNDKRYLPWDGDLRKIVEALLLRLKKGDVDSLTGYKTSGKNVGLRIPLPKLKRKFTQRDKDLFLRKAFNEVKTYFKRALTELESSYQEVQTDFMEVNNLKFIATIYIRGEISSRCKIWLGGPMSSDSIAYQSGLFNLDSDNSYNDLLQVTNNEQRLGFDPSSMWFGMPRNSREEIIDSKQAAEHLWRRFTDNLG